MLISNSPELLAFLKTILLKKENRRDHYSESLYLPYLILFAYIAVNFPLEKFCFVKKVVCNSFMGHDFLY